MDGVGLHALCECVRKVACVNLARHVGYLPNSGFVPCGPQTDLTTFIVVNVVRLVSVVGIITAPL